MKWVICHFPLGTGIRSFSWYEYGQGRPNPAWRPHEMAPLIGNPFPECWKEASQ